MMRQENSIPTTSFTACRSRVTSKAILLYCVYVAAFAGFPGVAHCQGVTRVLGGWVGDDDWTKPLPSYMSEKLDYLDLGYLTCISTLANGPCGSPGQRSAAQGPPAALAKSASCVSFVLGGAGCDTSQWNAQNIASGAKSWCGVDFDNECSMTAANVGDTINELGSTKTTVVSFLTGDPGDTSFYRWLTEIKPTPSYFASLTFWASEFCPAADELQPPGCVTAYTGYEDYVPEVIGDVLAVIGKENSQRFILGLHSSGINSETVDFWCKQVTNNNLGGIFVSFIHNLSQDLYNKLYKCIKSSDPSPPDPEPPSSTCAYYTVRPNDVCYDIAHDMCGGNCDWSKVLFENSNCSEGVTETYCANMWVGQKIYFDCAKCSG